MKSRRDAAPRDARLETVRPLQGIRDVYYDTKYWENNSKLGYFDQKLYYLSQVEGYFEDNGVDMGFSTIFSAMFNGLDTLNGGNSSDASVRNQFIYRADNLCTYFNSVAGSLESVQKDINEEIYNSVSNINAIGEKIALLNKEINQIEVRGSYANELRDERALLCPNGTRRIRGIPCRLHNPHAQSQQDHQSGRRKENQTKNCRFLPHVRHDHGHGHAHL